MATFIHLNNYNSVLLHAFFPILFILISTCFAFFCFLFVLDVSLVFANNFYMDGPKIN